MLYIEKTKVPADVTAEISCVKADAGWKQADKADTAKIRSIFDRLDKTVVRAALVKEQKGLCAYCMSRIYEDPSTTIEHLKPIAGDGALAMDYRNMVACCDGGRRREDTPKILCCDAAKQEKTIHISPLDFAQMEKIRYSRQGKIYTDPKDEAMEADINQVLKLNGEIDEKGNIRYDTSTHLVHNRREVFKLVEKYFDGLSRKGKMKESELEKKVDMIQKENPYRAFAGVWLYFLKKRLEAYN